MEELRVQYTNFRRVLIGANVMDMMDNEDQFPVMEEVQGNINNKRCRRIMVAMWMRKMMIVR